MNEADFESTQEFADWREANPGEPSIMFAYRNRPKSLHEFEEAMGRCGIRRDNCRQKLLPLSIKQSRLFFDRFGLSPSDAICWFRRITEGLC